MLGKHKSPVLPVQESWMVLTLSLAIFATAFNAFFPTGNLKAALPAAQVAKPKDKSVVENSNRRFVLWPFVKRSIRNPVSSSLFRDEPADTSIVRTISFHEDNGSSIEPRSLPVAPDVGRPPEPIKGAKIKSALSLELNEPQQIQTSMLKHRGDHAEPDPESLLEADVMQLPAARFVAQASPIPYSSDGTALPPNRATGGGAELDRPNGEVLPLPAGEIEIPFDRQLISEIEEVETGSTDSFVNAEPEQEFDGAIEHNSAGAFDNEQIDQLDTLPIKLPPNRSLDKEDRQDREDEPVGQNRDLLLQSARNAVRLRDFELAFKRLTEYLRLYPDDGVARLEFVGVLAEIGRFETAANQLEHLMRQFPGDFQYIRRYADLQLQNSNYALAESPLRRLLQYPDYRIDAAIDLAKLFTWTNRPKQADNVYEQYLQHEYPNDPKRQIHLAELLTEINRPGRALELLLQIQALRPLDIRVLKMIVLASARTGNTVGTFEFIQQLQMIQPEDTTIRNELAQQLHNEEFYREAMMVDQQILAFDLQHMDALIRSVLSNLRIYEVAAARSTLSTLNTSTHPGAMGAKAEYHGLVGEFADSIAVYRRAVANNPHDEQSRIGLGNAYIRSGQFLRAAAEFGNVQPGNEAKSNQIYMSAQLSRARAFAHAHRFAEAIEIIDASMASNNGVYTDQILDTYINVMSLAKRYKEVASAIRSRLPEVLARPHRATKLRAQLGLALMRAGDFAESVQEFEALEVGLSETLPEIVYGRYKSHIALGDSAAAEKVMSANFGRLDSDVYLRVRVAELAMEDCDCCLARQVLQHLSRYCEHNLLIGNRLGEACMQCASCADSGQCISYFQGVLVQSPTNQQAALGIARVSGRQGNYELSDKYFQQTFRAMPDNIGLIREMARMVGQWKGPEHANAVYGKALALSSGEHLYDMAQNSPEKMIELERELETLGEMNARVSTEMAAKQLSGWQPLSTIDMLEGLAALEPNNEVALFEIGQSYSQLNRTCEAIAQYQRVLCVNPCNQEAKIAIARNQLEMRPQFHLHGTYRKQRGRDELASVTSFIGGGILQVPLGDEDEFIQFGYAKGNYDPPGGRTAHGDIATVRLQYKPLWYLAVWAQADYETFDYGYDDRINFNAGFRYRYIENATFRFLGQQENVVQNAETIRQDIYRTGFEIGNYWEPTRRIQVDALYRYWNYSDDNEAHDAAIHTGYVLEQGRRQVRLLVDVDLMAYREGTVRRNPPGLVDALHPYFSPNGFVFATAGLECRQYLSCNTFKGANVHWYELFLGGRVDNDGIGYGVARGQLTHDFYNWLTLTAHGRIIRSSVYDLTELGARLTMRF